MSDRDHALALLDMARDDLNALEGMQHPSLFGKQFFSDEIFGFHCQQAIEKSLKTWLSLRGIHYPHTHDLMALLQILEDNGESIATLSDLVDLNPFAVQYRYETPAAEDDEN